MRQVGICIPKAKDQSSSEVKIQAKFGSKLKMADHQFFVIQYQTHARNGQSSLGTRRALFARHLRVDFKNRHKLNMKQKNLKNVLFGAQENYWQKSKDYNLRILFFIQAMLFQPFSEIHTDLQKISSCQTLPIAYRMTMNEQSPPLVMSK